MALWQLDQRDEAMNAMDAALALDPDNWTYHNLKAARLCVVERPHEALEHANTSLRLAPEQALVHSLLGRVYDDLSQPYQAYNAHAAAVKLAPDNTNILNYAATHALLNERWTEAEDLLRRALAIHAHDAVMLNNLGLALRHQGHNEQAALAFRSAILADPNLKIAKRNAHRSLTKLTGGARAAGAMGIFAVVTKLGAPVAIVLTHAARAIRPSIFLICIILVIGSIGAAWAWRTSKRAKRLAALDPQLAALYAQLEADKRSGRL